MVKNLAAPKGGRVTYDEQLGVGRTVAYYLFPGTARKHRRRGRSAPEAACAHAGVDTGRDRKLSNKD
jgi:hypothetical protein